MNIDVDIIERDYLSDKHNSFGFQTPEAEEVLKKNSDPSEL